MTGPRTRQLALRAARVACGLALSAGAVGCDGAAQADDAGPMDAPLVFYEHDDAMIDARFPGDASCHQLIPTERVCCLLGGGEWYEYDGGGAECFIGVPGPFVPPADRRA